MRRPLTTASSFDADVEAALRWYRRQSPELSTRLASDVEVALGRILTQPGLGSAGHGVEFDWPELRSLALDGFPYRVYYVDTPHVLRALRLLHQSRDCTELIRDDPGEAGEDD